MSATFDRRNQPARVGWPREQYLTHGLRTTAEDLVDLNFAATVPNDLCRTEITKDLTTNLFEHEIVGIATIGDVLEFTETGKRLESVVP